MSALPLPKASLKPCAPESTCLTPTEAAFCTTVGPFNATAFEKFTATAVPPPVTSTPTADGLSALPAAAVYVTLLTTTGVCASAGAAAAATAAARTVAAVRFESMLMLTSSGRMTLLLEQPREEAP